MTVQGKLRPVERSLGRGRWTHLLVLIGVALAPCCQAARAEPSPSVPTVHEVGVATPDVVAVEVRDPPFLPGRIEKLDVPDSHEVGTWIRTGESWGKVIGPNRDHVRMQDRPPPAYLDRARVDDAGGYGAIGDRRVVKVFRKSVPYDSGMYRGSGGEEMTGASLKHLLYLQLDGPLAAGRHTIAWPSHVLPDTAFDYKPDATRAVAIHANQNGYGASDTGKVAYLSLWIPGGPNNGAVDFRRYGLNRFDIVDSADRPVFSGAISLRKAPADPETGSGLSTPVLEYPSASTPPVPIMAVVQNSPAVLRLKGAARFQADDRVVVDGLKGGLAGLNGTWTVGAARGEFLTLRDAAVQAVLPGEVSDANVRAAVSTNRAGTYVFELDFGSWKPDGEGGSYRIRIPGLGVSDPFPVDTNAWLRAAKVSAGGLYNQRSGIALDGRFGFERPVSGRPGPGFRLLDSRMPFVWSTESGTGYLPFADASRDPWVTAEPAPADFWGGYMDAGDWDRRIQHLDIAMLLLTALETGGEKLARVQLGSPKSGEVLDAALYSGTDDLPDILHEAIWGVDFFRRLQGPDGSVRGGIDCSGGPMLGEPSYLYHELCFAYAADHVSTYRFAGVAAKLSLALGESSPRLAALYRDASVKAWIAGERARRDIEGTYAAALSTARAAGKLSPDQWDKLRATLVAAADEQRIAAAGTLFRLTGDKEYRDAFEQAWMRADIGSKGLDGAWDYLHAPVQGTNEALRSKIRQHILQEAGFIANGSKDQAYRNLKNPWAPLGWGQGLAPDYAATMALIRGYALSKNPDILAAAEMGSAQILGANQLGLSFTTGLGIRTVRHPLHEDHRAMGVAAPPGITIYGWTPPTDTYFDWIFGPYWSPLPVSGTGENAQARRFEPDRRTFPVFEYIVEHPQFVEQQEYTVHQSIGTTLALWLVLYAETNR